MPTPKGYSRTQIRLHWIVAGLIALQFLLSDFIGEAWEKIEHGGQVAFSPLVAAHVFGGGLILLLVLWRLVLRLMRGAPPPPAEEPPALQQAAHVAHWAFYGLMILLPVSGAVAWFGGVELAAEGHEALTSAMVLLVAVHVAAAFYHQLILRTGIMSRMKHPEN
ncbi:cytochrome b [Actibacterium sp. XHP0104]|uniref:cytochrome b n=1 Tax=Actibacterium sp. XHP0104 TaxID=2984335 RepID=UPI0021E7C4AB|nr:cytochrome b/b6 domain-containing protein [Actibacterium sp. XHP0104]MCV2882920.1 cytochrome b/b6 domain-containing protein [Actibacterium sp. XHP0104]